MTDKSIAAARKALDTYSAEISNTGEPTGTQVADLIADLMHVVKRAGEGDDPHDIVEQAVGYFNTDE